MKAKLLIGLAIFGLSLGGYAQSVDVERNVEVVRGEPGGSVGFGGTPPGAVQATRIFPAQGVTNMAFVSSGAMMGGLYPPELIMQSRERLSLTAAQENAIKDEMRSFQSGIVDIQWELNAAQTALDKALNSDRIAERESLALVDRLMAAENALKKSHLGMLIRIHNVLNADQIAKLAPPYGGYMTNFTVPTPYPNLQWNTVP